MVGTTEVSFHLHTIKKPLLPSGLAKSFNRQSKFQITSGINIYVFIYKVNSFIKKIKKS